jgi:hypothetical protein
MGGIIADQEDILANLPADFPIEGIEWRQGGRNCDIRIGMIGGEEVHLVRALHRFDGQVAITIKGPANNQRGRDMVARVLSEMAELVRKGRISFV